MHFHKKQASEIGKTAEKTSQKVKVIDENVGACYNVIIKKEWNGNVFVRRSDTPWEVPATPWRPEWRRGLGNLRKE